MITHVTYSDWEQFYRDGKCFLEGHSVSGRQMLDYLNRAPEALECHVEIESIDMSTLPNNDFEVDNLAEGKDLTAIRKAKRKADRG